MLLLTIMLMVFSEHGYHATVGACDAGDGVVLAVAGVPFFFLGRGV